HDETEVGPALDPLCNECVNRICKVDPACCGDPGSTYYPGSLVWDQHCIDLRQTVCRSGSESTDVVWNAGAVAPKAGPTPTLFLRGAIGAFEGIVTETDGVRYAEGWACDPDHKASSSPVQISIGGTLGDPATIACDATGAHLCTITADQTLAAGWVKDVSDEC